MRVMVHGQIEPQKVSAPDVLATLTEHLQGIEANMKIATAERIAELSDQVQRITNTLQQQQAQPDMSLILAQVVEQLDTRYTQRMETMIERTVERVRVSIVQQSEQQHSGRARLSIVNGPPLEVDTSDGDIGQQIRALLLEDSTLSARALAGRAGCSPTTASKWKNRIEAETQAQ